MPEPKFKVGDIVKVESPIAPQYNQERTRVINVVSREDWIGYQVEGQPDMSLYYRESSLKKVHNPITNEQILVIFLKKNKKFASFKRQFNVEQSIACRAEMEEMEVKEAINYSLRWRITDEGASFWSSLEDSWFKLVEEFKLKGTINMKTVLKTR